MQRKQLLAILWCYPNLREENTPSQHPHLAFCQPDTRNPIRYIQLPVNISFPFSNMKLLHFALPHSILSHLKWRRLSLSPIVFITYTLFFNTDGAKQKLQSSEQPFSNRGAQREHVQATAALRQRRKKE
jgi:hypothetical protein